MDSCLFPALSPRGPVTGPSPGPGSIPVHSEPEARLIHFGLAPTRFGPAAAIWRESQVLAFGFAGAGETLSALIRTLLLLPLPGDAVRNDTGASALAGDLIDAPSDGSGKWQPFLCGTPFQVAVWKAVRAIPQGQTRTYTEVATAIGRPTAARAVGSALAANRIAILVPCHRVCARNSGGGFRWGPELKQTLLARESGCRSG